MDYQQAVKQIRSRLQSEPPRKRNWPGFRPAAVLIPLLNRQGEAHVLLTLRTDRVEHHKGQISFPGGAKEEQDRSLLETAIRETEEELGIPAANIHILGEGDDFPTITNFMVTPFACTIEPIPEYHPNPEEVAEVLEVPLDLFLTDRYFEIQKRTYNDLTFPVFFYHYRHYLIWGATAFIMNRFVEKVFGFNPAPFSVLEDPRGEQYLRENMEKRGMRKKLP